jgi:adenylate kinase
VKFIVITGTPGTGKTTVAKLLSKKIQFPILELSKKSLSKDMVNKFDEKRNTWILDLKKIANRIIDQAPYNRDQSVIFESHHAHLVSPKKITQLVIILRCSPEKLEERLRKRGYSQRKIAENMLSELLDIILIETIEKFPSEIICEIDTTHKKPIEIVHKILSILRGKEGKIFGKIDWIKKLIIQEKICDILEKIEEKEIKSENKSCKL